MFFKKLNDSDYLKKEFKFLKDWGYNEFPILKTQEKSAIESTVLNFGSNKFRKHIELHSSAKTRFNCIIRRIKDNGDVADYDDYRNELDNYELGLLHYKSDFKTQDFYCYSFEEWQNAIANTKKLILSEKEKFQSKDWFETDLLESYKEKYTDSFRLDKANRYEFIDTIKEELEKSLLPNNFNLEFENKKIPPYHSDNWVDQLIFKRKNEEIIFRQADWRDYTNYYYLKINGDRVAEFDISKIGNDPNKIIQDLIEKIKMRIEDIGSS